MSMPVATRSSCGCLRRSAFLCAAAAVFQKLGVEEAKAGGAQVPGFLRTHPLTEDRIRNVQKQLPAASIIYDASDCESSRSHMLDSMFGPQVAVRM